MFYVLKNTDRSLKIPDFEPYQVRLSVDLSFFNLKVMLICLV